MINFDNLGDPGNLLYFVGTGLIAVAALLYAVFTLPDPGEKDDEDRR